MDKEKEFDLTAETVNDADKPTADARHDKNGNRRGQSKAAAWIGRVISLFCVIGVIATVWGAVWGIQKLSDTSALEEELYYFLKPVIAYSPEPFDDIATAAEQDAFLDAAAYRVTIAEQIRMMQEQQKNSNAEVTCQYPVDEQGRIAIPVEEIEASYRALFGPDAPLTHRSVEENALTYSAADKCYYVPFNELMTGYQPVIASFKRGGSSYVVRVGFVANNDIVIDQYGNQVPPTAEQASYFQTYTFKRTNENTYYIAACTHE
ncbi:MAG: hypothetical protein IJB26_06995 [Clostridia bacterium]|nr:hypothetical protein [Clostridia bacterium]